MQIEIETKRVQLKDVKLGDYLKSYDHDKDTIVYNKVTDYFFPEVSHHNQAKILFDGGELITSDIHYMWVKSGDEWDYKKTKDLIPGDQLLREDHVIVNVTEVELGKQTEETSYRDLTVEGNHNYFVAKNANSPMVLGHNSATTHFPFWHREIEDIIVLKNNKGTEDNRVRKLDYSIQLNSVFYKRVVENGDITLFSPHDVPDLYEHFGDEQFEELYLTAERRHGISTTKINARQLFADIVKERIETGRIYIMNIDNVNAHSSFTVPIRMSNLCLTGDTVVNVVSDGQAMVTTLEEVVNSHTDGKSIHIRSKNIETNEIAYKSITDAALTAKNAKLMRITDDDTGKSVVCTPNHKIFTKNRGYVEAGKLVDTDELDMVHV